MTQGSNLLAATKRLRARLRYAEARNAELEELLARALAAGDALDAMLGQILSGGDER
jgi:hypothetical protein